MDRHPNVMRNLSPATSAKERFPPKARAATMAARQGNVTRSDMVELSALAPAKNSAGLKQAPETHRESNNRR